MRREGETRSGGWDARPGPPFSWREIETYFSENPDKESPFPSRPVRPKECQFCGNECSRDWWSSGSQTWKHLCGCAGFLEYCWDCKAWYEVEIVIQN